MIRQPVLELKGINFDYSGHQALEGVDLVVPRGEFLGLLGPNGAGKSTLLRIAVGLLRPSSGTVSLFGEPLGRFKDWARVGYVSQHAAHLEPGFPATVWEVVSAGRFARVGRMRRMKAEDRLAVETALEITGLTHLRKHPVGLLSGGQRQRVAIGRALAGAPELMLLDEPAVGVDTDARENFYDLLVRLNRDLQVTLVLVSHDLEAVAARATRVAWLHRRVLFLGRPEDLLHQELMGLYGPRNGKLAAGEQHRRGDRHAATGNFSI